MGVQLNQDGVGYVQNMPIGTAIEDETDGYCIQDSEERYSGPITWKTITEYDFEISFGDSNYVISDGAGKFGSQSWDELRIPVWGEQPEFGPCMPYVETPDWATWTCPLAANACPSLKS